MVDQKVEFLFLSQEEMIEAGVLDMQNCVDVMEKTFRLLGEGDYLMGGPSGNHHGMKTYFPKEPRGPRMPVDGPDRRFMAMVSYLASYAVAGKFQIFQQDELFNVLFRVESPVFGGPFRDYGPVPGLPCPDGVGRKSRFYRNIFH